MYHSDDKKYDLDDRKYESCDKMYDFLLSDHLHFLPWAICTFFP